MLRHALIVATICLFCLTVGCGKGGGSDATNPDNLEYSKEGPPKRAGGISKPIDR